jgi:hypothetical protein
MKPNRSSSLGYVRLISRILPLVVICGWATAFIHVTFSSTPTPPILKKSDSLQTRSPRNQLSNLDIGASASSQTVVAFPPPSPPPPPPPPSPKSPATHPTDVSVTVSMHPQPQLLPKAKIISRDKSVTVTSDVRGNLGPCSVVIQDPPGSNWLKDRWQAASDMGGTSIPGVHWLLLDFHKIVRASALRLDWETAFAEKYRVEVIVGDGGAIGDITQVVGGDNSWTTIFDGTVGEKGSDGRLVTPGRVTTSSGQSPGVKQKMPLHIVHDIVLDELNQVIEFRYMRLYILKPAAGWGVSLWEFDVVGWEV